MARRKNAPQIGRSVRRAAGQKCSCDAGELTESVTKNDAVARAAIDEHFAFVGRVLDVPVKANATGPVATIIGTAGGITGATAATISLGAEHMSDAWVGTLSLASGAGIVAMAMWVYWLRWKTASYVPPRDQDKLRRRSNDFPGRRKKKRK